MKQQVPKDRRKEIERYLKLFGYKPERTILQVHEAGSFGRVAQLAPREAARREAAAARYGGRTFIVVGRTHDPTILDSLIPPKSTRSSNPGYEGYLFVGKDPEGRPPHELLPLDFVPAGIQYPEDWKSMFHTKGYLIAMHVPSTFALKKNEVQRRVRRIGGAVDVKHEWIFLEELEEYGYNRDGAIP